MYVGNLGESYLFQQNGEWQLADIDLNTKQAYAPTFPDEHMILHRTKEGITYTATHYHFSLFKPLHILFKEHSGIPAISTQQDNPDYMNSGNLSYCTVCTPALSSLPSSINEAFPQEGSAQMIVFFR